MIEENELELGAYVEPYAGGAAIALEVLLHSRVPRVVVNDIDPSVYSFWVAVKEQTEELCRRVRGVRVSMAEWRRQKEVQSVKDPDVIDLAFSTLFLNRTNRSGVLLAGVIGGKGQRGSWKMDARFNKQALISRIEAIGAESDRLIVTKRDAADVVRQRARGRASTLFLLDPPYYHKTDRRLYRDDYVPSDHERMARLLRGLRDPWLLSYDDCREVRKLYQGFRPIQYSLSYTAGRKRRGSEVLFLSGGLKMPSKGKKHVSQWLP